jgi:hypothetical protein
MEKIKITNGINGTNYRLETREASLVRLNEGIYALELRIEPKEGEDTTQPRAIHHYDEVNNKVITQIFLNEDRVKELSGVFTSEVIRSESIKLDKGLVKLTRNNLLDLDSFSYPEFLIVDESYDDKYDKTYTKFTKVFYESTNVTKSGRVNLKFYRKYPNKQGKNSYINVTLNKSLTEDGDMICKYNSSGSVSKFKRRIYLNAFEHLNLWIELKDVELDKPKELLIKSDEKISSTAVSPNSLCMNAKKFHLSHCNYSNTIEVESVDPTLKIIESGYYSIVYYDNGSFDLVSTNELKLWCKLKSNQNSDKIIIDKFEPENYYKVTPNYLIKNLSPFAKGTWSKLKSGKIQMKITHKVEVNYNFPK